MPAQAQSPQRGQPLVLSDRAIQLTSLPAHQAAYNPSMVAWGEGVLLAFRIDGTEGPRSTRIGIVALDPNFNQLGEPTLLDLRAPNMPWHTAEDPRLVVHEDAVYLVYNATEEPLDAPPRALNLARLDVVQGHDGGASLRRVNHIKLHVPREMHQRYFEKNWTPFVHAEALHFIYSTNPPHVLRLPKDAWQQETAAVMLEAVSSGAHGIAYAPGEMRGGTPAMWDERTELYAAFFHGKFSEWVEGQEKYFATIGFYAFSGAQPFEIDGVVRVPIEPAHLHEHDTATLSCAYPGGFLQRGGRIYLVYGWQDHAIHLLELDRDVLWEALERS